MDLHEPKGGKVAYRIGIGHVELGRMRYIAFKKTQLKEEAKVFVFPSGAKNVLIEMLSKMAKAGPSAEVLTGIYNP